MKVSDLIAKLQKLDQDRVVIMSKDGEGNDFSPLDNIETAAYCADSTWSGEVGLEKLTDKDRERGYDEEDVKENGVPAAVLWPVN